MWTPEFDWKSTKLELSASKVRIQTIWSYFQSWWNSDNAFWNPNVEITVLSGTTAFLLSAVFSLACLKKDQQNQSAHFFFTWSQNLSPHSFKMFLILKSNLPQSVWLYSKQSWLHPWLMTVSMSAILFTPATSIKGRLVTHGSRLNCLTRGHYRRHMLIKYFRQRAQAFWQLCIMLTRQFALRRFSEDQFENEPLCLARYDPRASLSHCN